MADAPAWASFTWRDPANESAELTLKARLFAIAAIKHYDDGTDESGILIGTRWHRVLGVHTDIVTALSGDDVHWVEGTYRDPEQASAEVTVHIRSLAIDAVYQEPGDLESTVLVRGTTFRLPVTTPVTDVVDEVKTSEPGPGGGDGGVGGGGGIEVSIV